MDAGLPYLNFQMGFIRVRMGYLWGTTALLMGYIIGVHVIIFKIEEYARKVGEKKLLLKKQSFSRLFPNINQFYCSFFTKKGFIVKLYIKKNLIRKKQIGNLILQHINIKSHRTKSFFITIFL
jgi:hypothetical protein